VPKQARGKNERAKVADSDSSATGGGGGRRRRAGSRPKLRFNPALSLPLDAWEDEVEAFGRRYDEVGEDETETEGRILLLVVGSTLYVE